MLLVLRFLFNIGLANFANACLFTPVYGIALEDWWAIVQNLTVTLIGNSLLSVDSDLYHLHNLTLSHSLWAIHCFSVIPSAIAWLYYIIYWVCHTIFVSLRWCIYGILLKPQFSSWEWWAPLGAAHYLCTGIYSLR